MNALFICVCCLLDVVQTIVALLYLVRHFLETNVKLVYVALHVYVYVNSTICMCELHCCFIQVFVCMWMYSIRLIYELHYFFI